MWPQFVHVDIYNHFWKFELSNPKNKEVIHKNLKNVKFVLAVSPRLKMNVSLYGVATESPSANLFMSEVYRDIVDSKLIRFSTYGWMPHIMQRLT